LKEPLFEDVRAIEGNASGKSISNDEKSTYLFQGNSTEDRFGYRPSTPEPTRLKTAIIITLSTVHRHFCYSDYCYSKASCRFGFPLRLENKSKIEFEEMNGGGIRASYAEEMILEEICTTESSWYTGEQM
jgi:hypothetical protein